MPRNPYEDTSRNFDPAKPVYARRPFIADGRRLNPGDLFEWKRMSLTKRRVKLMFEASRLRHSKEDVDPQPAPDNTKTVMTEDGPMQVQVPDELDDTNDMSKLRAIADKEGAKPASSKALQRKHIRENREEVGFPEEVAE